jgi:hypothetical protein
VNQKLVCLLSSTLLAASTSALAAGTLTPQECGAYPFVQANGPLTHKDVMRKLALLESAGFSPAIGEAEDYPHNVLRAQAKLNARYMAECRPA